MKKYRTLGLVFALLMGLMCFNTSCADSYDKAFLTVVQDSYTLFLQEGEISECNFTVSIDEVSSGTLYYSLRNDGNIKVTLSRSTDTLYNVNVQAIKPGDCQVEFFLAENRDVTKIVNISVVQSIESIYIDDDYEYYAKIGERTVLDLGVNVVVNPSTANKNFLRYEIVENPSDLPVQLSELGVLDATSCSLNGDITVRVFAQEDLEEGQTPSVYADFTIHLITAVQNTDLSINLKYANDRNAGYIYRHGVVTEDTIELIKTGSTSEQANFLNYYNQANLSVEGILGFNSYLVEYKIEGNSVGSTFANGNWYEINENRISLQGISLGTSTLKVRVNIRGAEEFLPYIEMQFNVVVIDAPISVEITDPIASSGHNVQYDDNLGVYVCNVFNNYAEGELGQAVSFVINPYSVADANAKVVIDLSNIPVNEKIKFLNADGSDISIVDRKIIVSAGDIIYIKSISTESFVPTYDLKVYSEFSERFVGEGGNLISATLRLALYQGITTFDIVGEKELYLNLEDQSEISSEVSLNIGNANANTDGIYYQISDSSLVSVTKINDVNYRVTALNEGLAYIYFYSGNGYQVTVQVRNYYPIKSIQIKTPSEFENGYIGNRVFDASGNLSTITVQINGAFTFEVIANNGQNATIADIEYSVRLVEGAGLGIIDMQTNTRTITIKGVGKVRIYIYVYGYNASGMQNQMSGDAKSLQFVVQGYIPVQSLELSTNYVVLKDPSTLAYNKISNYSKTIISASINPSNATYSVEDLEWSVQDGGLCSVVPNGLFLDITAGIIENVDQESQTFIISATLKVLGRTFMATCEVKVEKAQKVSNIYIDNVPYMQVTFDSRNGLGQATSSNDFEIDARVAPSTAFDKTLQYDVVSSTATDGSNEPVFMVLANGTIRPLRGGVGVLRIAPQDSFKDADTPNEDLVKYITIIVEDGLSEQTAYSIKTASQLKEIGANSSSLSKFYKLSNNISLSTFDAWEAIGTVNAPFTGWFSGADTIYAYKTNDLGQQELVVKEKVQYTISDLNFHATLSSDDSGLSYAPKSRYYGLFGVVKGYGICDVDIIVGSVNIDASAASYVNIYFGFICAYAESTICNSFIGGHEDVNHECNTLITLIKNCSVVANHSINIKTSKYFSYIGGLVGQSRFANIINVDKICVSLSEINIISNSQANLYAGGVIGYAQSYVYKVDYTVQGTNSENGTFYYMDSTPIYQGAGFMSGDTLSGEIVYSTLYGKSGYDVYIDAFNVENQSATSAIGGVVGYNSSVLDDENSVVVQEQDKDIVELVSFSEFNSIVDACVYVNINCVDTNNVGGIVGIDEVGVKDVYFDGTINACNNVGGIAGLTYSNVQNAKVITYATERVIQGKENVGGIVGYLSNAKEYNTNRIIAYSYVSGIRSNAAISGSVNVGSIVGLTTSVAIIGVYSDVFVQYAFNIEDGCEVSFSFGYLIDSSFVNGSIVTNAYYAYTENSEVTEIVCYNGDGDISTISSIVSLSDNFIEPKEIGDEYKTINYSLPIIKYNDKLLYNVIFTSMQIVLNKDNSRSIILKDEQNEQSILLFYYELDNAYAASLTTGMLSEARNVLLKENSYALGELFSLVLSPKPFNNVMIRVQVLDKQGQQNSTIAYINNSGNLIIVGEGVFILRLSSKVNPSIVEDIYVTTVNYVSNFGVYERNEQTSNVYSITNAIDWRKQTSTEAYAIFQTYFNDIQNDREHVLKTTEYKGVIYEINQNSNVSSTLISQTLIGDDDSELIREFYGAYKVDEEYVNGAFIVDENQKYDFVYGSAMSPIKIDANLEAMSAIGNAYSYYGVEYLDNILIGEQSYAEYKFILNLNEVQLSGVSTSLVGGAQIVYDSVTVGTQTRDIDIGQSVTIFTTQITILTNGDIEVVRNLGAVNEEKTIYIAVKTNLIANFNARVNNALFVQVIEGVNGVEYSYFAALYVKKNVREKDSNILRLYAEHVEAGLITAKPYIYTYDKNGEEIITELNTATLHAINMSYNVYEGAKSIEVSMEEAVYSPSDAINMQVYLISDKQDDQIIFERAKSQDNLIVNIEKLDVITLANGDYKTTFDVVITLYNSFEARYLMENKIFDLCFSALSVPEVRVIKQITYLPQPLQRLDMVNYHNISIDMQEGEQFASLRLENDVTPSSYITSSANGILSIDMYPSYADVDAIHIFSDTQQGKNIQFWQMYQHDINLFKTLGTSASYADQGRTLILQKKTTLTSFTGKMYIRTFLESGVSAGAIFTITIAGYKINKQTNAYEMVLSNEILLEVTGAPQLSVQSVEGTYQVNDQNFAIAGKEMSVQVKLANAYTLIGDPVISITRKDGLSNLGAKLESIVAVQNPISTTVNGVTTYTYKYYVGAGIEQNTSFTFNVKINYTNEGVRQEDVRSYDVTIVRYMISKVGLKSPFSLNEDYAFMYAYTNYNVEVVDIELEAMYSSTSLVPLSENMANEQNKELYSMLLNYGGYIDNSGKLYPIIYNDGIFTVTGLQLTNDQNQEVGADQSQEIVFDYQNNCFTFEDMPISKDGLKYKEGLALIKIKLIKQLNKYLTTPRNEGLPNVLMYNNTGALDVFETIKSEGTMDADIIQKIEGSNGDERLIIKGMLTGNNYKIRLQFDYDLLSGNIGEEQNNEQSIIATYSRVYDTSIALMTDVNLPKEIETQEDFENMESGHHYILLKDLNLTSYTPIDLDVASFDGNSKTIRIISFSQEALNNTNIALGLFNNINSNVLVKNIIVDISNIKMLNLTHASTIKIGLFAVNNNGIITNCNIKAGSTNGSQALIPQQTINDKRVSAPLYLHTIQVKVSANYSSIPEIAMFVTTNNASITHSRVMNTKDSDAGLCIMSGGVISGFVVTNNGDIASSYSSNVSIVNELSVVKDTKTAGFVITNNGDIIQSFVANHVSSSSNYRADTGYIMSNGIVVGFAYTNARGIKDCYSNLPLISNAAVAGFVYENQVNGTIENTYSACLVKTNSAVHMPYIGVSDLGVLQNFNNEGLKYNYYLGTKSNQGEYAVDLLTYPAESIAESKFEKETSFGGFSFGSKKPNSIISKDLQESVWFKGSNGPNLYSAENVIAPTRYLNIDENNNKSFLYSQSCGDLGTAGNPLIISNAAEYNAYMLQQAQKVSQAQKTYEMINEVNVRIVHDIDFDDVNKEIGTTQIPFVNGNIEGNGFTLSNIVLQSGKSSSQLVDSIGLFSYIYSSNIRNINLEIVQADCENVRVLGGLAGVIIDSSISSIEVTSTCVMSARFVSGGVAGIVIGLGELNNVHASASININYKPSVTSLAPNTYISGVLTGEVDSRSGKLVGIEKVKNISYAGGVVGIADLKAEGDDKENGSGNTAYENVSTLDGYNINNASASGAISISAQFVGGLFGYIGMYTHVSNSEFELLYNDENNLQFFDTEYCVGGIAAVNYGIISRTAVKHSDYYDKIYEQELYTYLRTGQDVRLGKKNLFKGDIWYAGGIVGINYLGSILYCYSNADIEDRDVSSVYVTEQYLGGIVGQTYVGNIQEVYSTGNVYTAKSVGYVGGIIGRYGTVEFRDDMQQSVLNKLYAINVWNRSDVSKMFTSSSNRAGVIVGYVADTHFGVTSANAHITNEITIGDSDNYLNNVIYTVDELSGLPTINTIGTSRASLTIDAELSSFNYSSIFNELEFSTTENFFNALSKDLWKTGDCSLPKLKKSAYSMEEVATDLFSFLYYVNTYPFKAISIGNPIQSANQDEEDGILLEEITIDFDITKYKVKDNMVYFDPNYDASQDGAVYNGQLMSDTYKYSYKINSGNIVNQTDNSISLNVELFGGLTETADENGYYSFQHSIINYRNFINDVFTGKLIGANNNGVTSKLINLDYSATVETDEQTSILSMSLFKQLRKANINNLTFVLSSKQYTDTAYRNANFAGIALEDSSSAFYNVHVKVDNIAFSNYVFAGFIAKENGSAEFNRCSIEGKFNFTSIENDQTESARKFGGFVADASEDISYIRFNSCSSKATVVYNDSLTSNNRAYSSYIGMFAGQAKNMVTEAINEIYAYSGEDNIITAYKNESSTADSLSYIGALVGRIENSGNVSGVLVHDDIHVSNYVSIKVGLVAGESKDTNFSSIQIGSSIDRVTLSALNLRGTISNYTNADEIAQDCAYIGGLVGYATVTQLNQGSSTNSVVVYADINATHKTNGENFTNKERFSVGGVIGVFNANLESGYTNSNVTMIGDIYVKANGEQKVYIGGVVGENILNSNISSSSNVASSIIFENVQSFADITFDGTQADMGGFLGAYTIVGNSTNTSYLGELTLQDSLVAGSISLQTNASLTNANVGSLVGKNTNTKVYGCTLATTLYLSNNLYNSTQNENVNIGIVYGQGGKGEFGNSASGQRSYVLDEIIGVLSTSALSGYDKHLKEINQAVSTYANWLEDVRLGKVYYSVRGYDKGKTNLGENNIFNPDTDFSNGLSRYNLVEEGTTIVPGIEIEDQKSIIVFNMREVRITNTSLFTNIGAQAIVSNIVLVGENASVPMLISGVNQGTIIGVYATGTSVANTILINEQRGVLQDVMIDVVIEKGSACTINWLTNTTENSYISNVQILGSVNFGSGTTTSSAINLLAGNSRYSYYEHIVVAPNIIADNYTINSAVGSGNVFDTSTCRYDKSILKYIDNFTGYEGYKKNDKSIWLLRASYNQNYNYDYPYLIKFKKYFENADGSSKIDIGVVNNFSRLLQLISNNEANGEINHKFIYNLNINQASASFADVGGSFKGVLDAKKNESENYSIFGIKVATKNSTSIGVFEKIVGGTIQNINLHISKSIQYEGQIMWGQFGVLAHSISEGSKIENVEIAFSSTNWITGMVVGGVAATIKDSTLNKITLQNARIRALDAGNGDQVISNKTPGVAGGICAYAENSTIQNCNLISCTIIGGNADAEIYGQDAGVVGGICAYANQTMKIDNNTVGTGTRVVIGDAADGKDGLDATKGGTDVYGEHGGNGGNVYAGIIVGKLGYKFSLKHENTKCSIEESEGDLSTSTTISLNTTSVNNSLYSKYQYNQYSAYTLERLREENYSAGKGGNGGNGCKGANNCEPPCDPRYWLQTTKCPNVQPSSNGGNGGNGGKSYIGAIYGQKLNQGFIANATDQPALNESFVICAPGGDGGSGVESAYTTFRLMLLTFVHFGDGGNGGNSGFNGNNAGQVLGKKHSGREGGAGGVYDETKSSACILQS